MISSDCLVLLKTKRGEKYLPIWIGKYEADLLNVANKEIQYPRQMTHDLLVSLLGILEGRLQSVQIHSVVDGEYLGALMIERNGQLIQLDCRPSDGIILALRCQVPIMVAMTVLSTDSIYPESYYASHSDRKNTAVADNSPSGLSMFEDLLRQLDDNRDDHSDDDGDDDDDDFDSDVDKD